jgi:hypothetical protein
MDATTASLGKINRKYARRSEKQREPASPVVSLELLEDTYRGMVSRWSLHKGFGASTGAVEDQIQQIEEDKNVDGEQANVNPGDVAVNFEELPRQERSSNGESEEFAPGLFKIEADAFGEGDGSIAIGEQANAAQDGIVDEGGFLKDEGDEARLGIEAQVTRKDVDFVGEIFVEKTVGADSDGDKEQGVEEFINRNDEQKAIVALATVAG